MSGPISELCSEHLSILFQIIGLYPRSQTLARRRGTSTIAKVNLDVTRSIFVRSRYRSTTYRLKRSSDVGFFPCGGVHDYRKEDLFTMFCYFKPVIRHSFQAMCTVFSRKDFFRLFAGLLRISTRKTNAEPRCLTSSAKFGISVCF